MAVFSSRQAPHNTCVWHHRSRSQVYTTAWRRSAVDSIVLPTTQKFMINHLGFGYTMKQPFHVRPEPMLLILTSFGYTMKQPFM